MVSFMNFLTIGKNRFRIDSPDDINVNNNKQKQNTIVKSKEKPPNLSIFPWSQF